MDYQLLVNGLFTFVGLLGGWAMKMLWESVRDIKTDHGGLRHKVQQIEVLVAGNYVRREEMDSLTTRLFQKLDHIEHKMDRKADK